MNQSALPDPRQWVSDEVDRSQADRRAHDDRNIAAIAAKFGCKPEEISAQFAKNWGELADMERKAYLTGRKVNGYTSEQIRQMMNNLPFNGTTDWREEARHAADAPRVIHYTLTAEEFHALRWAAMHTKDNGKIIPLAEFYRRALLAALRATVAERIQRGKSIPPDIAALVDSTRAATKPDEPAGLEH